MHLFDSSVIWWRDGGIAWRQVALLGCKRGCVWGRNSLPAHLCMIYCRAHFFFEVIRLGKKWTQSGTLVWRKCVTPEGNVLLKKYIYIYISPPASHMCDARPLGQLDWLGWITPKSNGCEILSIWGWVVCDGVSVPMLMLIHCELPQRWRVETIVLLGESQLFL